MHVAITAGLINAGINAPLGWVAVPAQHMLPIWGVPGVALDLVTTAFGSAVGMLVVMTPQIRRKMASGRLARPTLPAPVRSRLAHWPHRTWSRALSLGLLTVLVAAPLPLASMAVLGVAGLDRGGFTLLKGGFALAVGVLLAPVVLAAAVAEDHRDRRSGGSSTA
ncbi:MAG: hypothetical protein HXY24_04680 [Rubrivivax sp.]|nr:hypothetical protein [Rubrivivax sp.]